MTFHDVFLRVINHKYVHLVIVFVAGILFHNFWISLRMPKVPDSINAFEEQPTQSDEQFGSLLDGCFHIFLDIGANRGTTTRKLFEPQLYPGALYLEYFDQYFGTVQERQANLSLDPKYICVVGFEANPRHTPFLVELENVYGMCGWHVDFIKGTALSDQNGVVTFFQGSLNDRETTGKGSSFSEMFFTLLKQVQFNDNSLADEPI